MNEKKETRLIIQIKTTDKIPITFRKIKAILEGYYIDCKITELKVKVGGGFKLL